MKCTLITKPEWFIEHKDITCVTPDKAGQVRDYLMGFDQMAFDSEASGLDVHTISLFCVQFGVPGYQVVADTRVLPVTFWKELLETKLLIGVNLKYDLKLLFKQGIRPTRLEDLMLQEILLTNGLYEINETKGKFSFQGLSEQYLGDKDIDKSIGASFAYKPLTEQLWEKEVTYSARDVINPLLIAVEQRKKIIERGLTNVCNLENNALLPIADMEYNGFRLDVDKWKVVQKHVDTKLQAAEKALNEYVYTTPLINATLTLGKKNKKVPAVYQYEGLAGPVVKSNISWSSPEQVLKAFQYLGINVDSTDQNVLNLIKDNHKIVELFLHWNKYDGLKSKFMDKMFTYINSATGCIHPDIWQIVSTGRSSCNKPNLQQLPSKGEEGNMIRGCFIPNEGEVLVDSDLSSAELRIIAEASQDPLWLQIYHDDGDLHSIICAKLFNIPLEDVKKPFPLKPDMKYRDVTKIINFMLAFGGSEYKLAETLGVSTEEAKQIIADYFKVVPKVKKCLDDFGKLGRSKFVSYTLPPFRRPRYFDKRKLFFPGANQNKILGEYERASKNGPIQGSQADWLKAALVLIYNYIRKHNFPAKIKIVVHDQIITGVPKDRAEEWAKIQTKLLEDAGKYIIKTIPVKADTQITTCWQK